MLDLDAIRARHEPYADTRVGQDIAALLSELDRLTAELAAAPESARRWSAIREAVATVQAATGLGGDAPLDDDAVAELLASALQNASRAHCAETALRVDAEANARTLEHHRRLFVGQQARAERAELELAAANAGKARLAEILGFEAESEEANRWKWLNLEVGRLKDELSAARRGPVVEWRQILDFERAIVGKLRLTLHDNGWEIRIADVFGENHPIATGTQTGPEGKSACFAAYLKAAGLA